METNKDEKKEFEETIEREVVKGKLKRFKKTIFRRMKGVTFDIEKTRSYLQVAIAGTKAYRSLDLEHQTKALLIVNEELDKTGETEFGVFDIARLSKRIEKRLDTECPLHTAKTENQD